MVRRTRRTAHQRFLNALRAVIGLSPLYGRAPVEATLDYYALEYGCYRCTAAGIWVSGAYAERAE